MWLCAFSCPDIKLTSNICTRSKWSRSLPIGSFFSGNGTDEEGDNLDVSCWDERDKELDISTYSLPLLDRTEGSSTNSFGLGRMMFQRSKSKDMNNVNPNENMEVKT